MRLKFSSLGLVLLVGAAGCGDTSLTNPAVPAPQFTHLDGGSCRGVQGLWTSSGNPVTGQFTGVIAGDLEGTTSTQAGLVPPGATGRVLHGAGVHTIELYDGDVLELESHWVIANGRLNASYTIVDGGQGSLTGHGPFIPDNLVLKYGGSVCR